MSTPQEYAAMRAERDALAAKVDAVRALAEEFEHAWLTDVRYGPLLERLRNILDGGDA